MLGHRRPPMNVGIQPALSAVYAPSLVERVYNHLRSHIISGSIASGTRLLELELATQMRVSQGSAREALGRLERDGLVERRERRGTFVTELAHDDMREVVALRAFVERFAVKRIVGRLQAGQQHELELVIGAMREAAQHREMFACVEHDHRFHQYIVQWSDHATLLRIWRPLSAQIQRFIVTAQPSADWEHRNIVAEHQHLLEALRGDDTEGAAARFEQHILKVWDDIEQA
jgi:DNA-binding GntR family transcriptional regulator